MRRKAEWKDETITARVTSEEKEKIKRKAQREGKSASQYVTDAALAGMERRKNKDKEMVKTMVNNQNIFNDIFKLLREKQISGELNKIFAELVEEENKLWRCLK